MKIVAWCAAVGGLWGAVVAVLVHFLSDTLPSHYAVGFVQMGNRVSLGSPPLVHPSWWPSLPASVAVGVLVGACGGLAASRVGLRVSRDDGSST